MKGLYQEGIVYKGFIFFGLINVEGDPYVIEYNARLGDPETEAIIPRIKSDLFDLFEGVAEGNLEKKILETYDRCVATIIIASGGYPEQYEKGKIITGLEETENCAVFHSGTKSEEGKIVTSGGRVLAISSWGSSVQDALDGSYRNAARIKFENMYFRPDIGFDLNVR